jgi:murein endopeptidase
LVERSQRTRSSSATPSLASALAVAALLATVPLMLHGLRGGDADASSASATAATGGEGPLGGDWPQVVWRPWRAVGRPYAGRLVGGVQLPVEGEDFFTWDGVLERSPNRGWRRYGTGKLVRILLRVASEFRAAWPGAPRVAIADLSRPHGGDFGRRFGGLGHASHQNGLDADIYYPRRDRAEAEAQRPRDIDRTLAQDLVDRFVEQGAQFVFVGPRTGLRGPRRVVQPLVHHDDHMHVRIRP